MLKAINTKILLSGATILAAAAIAIGATFAWFSDVETSKGNVLAAGAIDLQIDNESYVTDENGNLVKSDSTSWTLSDLANQLFFNFSDLKPGDVGEDTISLHVFESDAWLCAASRITEDDDVDCTEPEFVDDPLCAPGVDGELDEKLNFVFWADDGDNVLEQDEVRTIFHAGSIGSLDRITLADSEGGVLGLNGRPAIGSNNYFIGKAWCFGDLTADETTALPAQDNQGDDLNGKPVERGTGVKCDGSGVSNASQSDRIMGDLQFYAEQARNNDGFLCEENYSPVWPTG